MNDIEKARALADALADFRTYNVIRQAYIDAVTYGFSIGATLGYWNELRPQHWQSLDKITVYASGLSSRKMDYLVLLKQPNVDMGHSNNIIVNDKRKYKAPNGFLIEISNTYEADIPPEELAVLELIGKVEVEHIPAQPSRTEKRVFCPTGMGDPF